MQLLLLGVLLSTEAFAACPAGEPILGWLTCSDTIHGQLNVSSGSSLGSPSYTCGEPFKPLAQTNPEDVYAFECQVNGLVSLTVTDLQCDLDIYVLDQTCRPDTGCMAGSTKASNNTDSLSFWCNAGEVYYIVVEG